MTPRFTRSDTPSRCFSYFKQCGYFSGCIKRGKISNQFHLFLSKLVCASSLIHPVINVFYAISNPQMTRIYARAIVAFVKNPLSFWDFSDMHEPACNMSSNFPILPTSPTNRTTTLKSRSSIPFPTAIPLAKFCHESGRKRVRKTISGKKMGGYGIWIQSLRNKIFGCKLWSHNQSVFGCAAFPATVMARGHFYITPLNDPVNIWAM